MNQTATTNTPDTSNKGDAKRIEDANMVDMTQNQETPDKATTSSDNGNASKTGDIGPWMVMSYKNKKKMTTVTHGSNKTTPQGSRFTPIQNDDGVSKETNVPISDEPTKQTVEPAIVKLWRNMQHKLQNETKKQEQLMKPGGPAVSLMLPHGKPGTTNMSLKDISNVVSSSKAGSRNGKKLPKKQGFLVKDKATHPVTTPPSSINCNIDTGNMNIHSFLVEDAQFGHSPPEEEYESDMGVNVDNPTLGIDCEKTADAIENNASLAQNLSSSNEEDMVDS